MKNTSLLLLVFLLVFSSCRPRKTVDTIVFNGYIQTVNDSFDIHQSMAINDGKIMAIGSNAEIESKYKSKEIIDLKGQNVLPGLIDAHAHFLAYGEGLQQVNLTGTKSWEEVIERIKVFSKTHTEGWIVGRGWDQNDWVEKKFPDNKLLNQFFPDRAVVLSRVDGHALLANQKALLLSGIDINSKIPGGEILKAAEQLTGLLTDNAAEVVKKSIPSFSNASKIKALQEAADSCFAVGLTTIADCGLDKDDVELIKHLQENGGLKMKLYVMLSDGKKNFEFLRKNGKIKTDLLNVRAVKVYGDGALGSRGACLTSPYHDRKDWYGLMLSPVEHFDSVAKICFDNGWQMCTHSIGDSSNRTLLKVYAKYLKTKNDKRWRIEHAQVIMENDFQLFKTYSIIPSVQPTHATSDMYWAEDRLGKEKIHMAYAYKKLLTQSNWLPLGTDFPVEDISPFKTFYAAVVRQDDKGFPEAGFEKSNALTRIEALKGMTIWAAKSFFEEKEKGSLEVGKAADFIVLNQNILTCDDSEILNTKVTATFVQGEKVYGKVHVEN